jgi:hypothetical protein
LKRCKVIAWILALAFLFNLSFAKDKKEKSVKKEEIVVPVEKKINEKEFGKVNIKKKQKKEVEVEVK